MSTRELPGAHWPLSMSGSTGETEAGTGKAGCCFPWADAAFCSHSRPSLAGITGLTHPGLFFGVGQALSPSHVLVSLPAASAPEASPEL